MTRRWTARRAMGKPRLADDAGRRALRTGAAARAGVGWVWPWWLERQRDPSSPAFVPAGDVGFVANVTHRNWTTVGSLGSAGRAAVDPRGLVTPWPGGWSLDWWIGADDRWHLPSREVAVRQRLVEGMPVVETAMRVPGGDALQRVYGVGQGEGELVVVEIENASRLPVAVALAVRPYNAEGVAPVGRVALHGRTVTIDGRLALHLSKPPPRAAGSTFATGDVAEAVLSGAAGTRLPDGPRCPVGLATAALVFPLAHTATLRAAIPAVPRPAVRRSLGRRHRPSPALAVDRLPPAAVVARGWRAHGQRGMRLDLPDGRLAEAVEANRRYLLMRHHEETRARTPGRDLAHVVLALERYGLADEAAAVIRSWRPDHGDGRFGGAGGEGAGAGAALHALAEHWRLTGELGHGDDVVPVVARAAEWLERACRRREAQPGPVSSWLGPMTGLDEGDLWALGGLRDGAQLLRAAGEGRAGEDAERAAARLRAHVEHALTEAVERLVPPPGSAALGTGGQGLHPDVPTWLAACWPLRLLSGADPRVAAVAQAVRDHLTRGPTVAQGDGHGGPDVDRTLQLALVELEAGDRQALERLSGLLQQATPTWTWPQVIHPRLGGGCQGSGHHLRAAADLLTLVRNLCVREVDAGLALCTLLPGDWRGAPLEVHGAPTHAGTLSYAVRWHGERPALLWELRPRPGAPAVRLTAPGLDPSWSSTEASGECLLAPPAAPAGTSRSGEGRVDGPGAPA